MQPKLLFFFSECVTCSFDLLAFYKGDQNPDMRERNPDDGEKIARSNDY